MVKSRPYTVNGNSRLILVDAGINPSHVLQRAKLPADLYSHDRTTLDTEAFYSLWQAIDAEADDPALALRLGTAISVEAFSPLLFASLCSSDFNSALERISRYKPLVGPMRLNVDRGQTRTTLELEFEDDTSHSPPPLFILTELVFFVQLARIATRENLCPLSSESPILPEVSEPFTQYFGTLVRKGKRVRHIFSAEDAARPFLTANEKMWEVFEPDLRRRLSEVGTSTSITEKVRSVLLEMLPGGSPSMDAVARKLGLSSRTLQRRLQGEENTYQRILARTREELAQHYLENTNLPNAEISYLLGYEDPNCFFRAYQDWTGTTPAKARAAHQSSLPS